MKPRVLITYPLKESTLKHFDNDIEFVCIPGIEDYYKESYEMIDDFDGLMVFGLKVDEKLLSKSDRLKLVSNYAVGFDNIDVHFAKKKGIVVSNTPHSVTLPTANLCIGLMISMMRKISYLDQRIKSGDIQDFNAPDINSNSLYGKSLGIVGFGRIGEAVAKIAIPMGMNISYYKRSRLDSIKESELNVSYKTYKDILSQSDVISLHMPLNENTKGMIGKDEFALMKDSTFVVNTARGGVIDEDALYDALTTGKIKGAATDVFWNEPEIPNRFRQLTNLVMTPHSGTNTKEARRDMMIELHDNMVAYFKVGKVISEVVV